MGPLNIEGVLTEQLKIIPGELGEVLHVLKNTDRAYKAFGEAYFSTVKMGGVEGLEATP